VKFSQFAEINPGIQLDKKNEYCFVEMADLKPGQRYVEPKITKKLKGGAKFQNWDTLFARITPCLENGKISQVKNIKSIAGFGSTEFYVFRGREGVSDSAFVYYLALSDVIRGPAEKSMSGATGRQRADINAIKEIEIPQIDLADQKKVAALLSNYDDLMENNSRRINILEDMAQSLYREWFVKFRFPGHENHQFKDSPLGQIPDGWEVVSASEAMDINPRMKLAKDEEKLFVPMSGLSESSMIIGDIEMKAGNGGAKYTNGDTLFARITPCLQNGKTGYVQFLPEDLPIGFGSTEFIVFRSKKLTPEFVYCLARSSEFRENAIKSMTGATGRQRVQNQCFDNYLLAVPNDDLLKRFTDLATASFSQIHILTMKNENLRKQRDMLLPKLISGRVEI
tara:strand:+ start:10818 stop:12005 length:1188 start_codon:yes stop_codon:yes gene_type:complete